MEDILNNESCSMKSFSQILPRYQEGSQNVTQESLLKLFPNPAHIISPDFKSNHLKKLVQQLQKNKIPLQFQHETQTLGYDLIKNKNNFFVVVDNKNGKINLGEQFNSERMTIVGYPKIGRNQNNIYCVQPRQVVQAYKQFIAFKSGKPSKFMNQYDGSHISIGNNLFKPSNSQTSHIKLKCVSKLNASRKINKKFQQQYKAISKDKMLQNNIQPIRKQQGSVLLIFNPDKIDQNNVQTSITEQSQYKQMLKKILQMKLQKKLPQIQKTVFELKSFADLFNKVIDLKKRQLTKINCYILTESKNVDLMLKIHQNGHLLNQTRLIICFFQHNHDNKNPSYYIEDENKKIQITKKCNKLKNFHSLIFTQQECFRTLKYSGFRIEKDSKCSSSKKILQTQRIDVDSLCKKDFQSKNKIHSNSKINTKSLKKINFCPEQKQKANRQIQRQTQGKQEQKNQNAMLSGQKSQFIINPLTKCKLIRPISSLLSQRSQKSSLSSSISAKKLKIIKFNKQNNSIKEQKHISQVNSQYCNEKVKNILSKKLLSSKSLSNKNSNILKRSLDKDLKKQFAITSSQVINKQDSKSIRSQKTTYRKLKLLQNNVPQSFVVTQSRQSFSNLDQKSHQFLAESPRPTIIPQTPVFKDAQAYYFGSEYSFQDEMKNNKTHHAIDGMLYIQHNDIILSLIKKLKQKCPISLIPKKQYRPFYFARQYSQQLNRIWKQKKTRQCVCLLLDLQGLQEVIKYYSNIFYQDDQLRYYSNISERQDLSGNCQKFLQTAQAASSLKIICFVLMDEEAEQKSELFAKIKTLMYKLPIFKIHKLFNKGNLNCKVEQQTTKNLDLLYQHIYTKIMSQSSALRQSNGFGLLQTN